jgi:hypothetical protein
MEDVPTGWISETQLRVAIGTADEDRETFHRNLVNWRANGLLPRSYDGHKVPFSLPLGFPIGNEAYHPPITIEMVGRINELRQCGGDMDKWLWQLWLDGYPIDIIGWCRTRLTNLDGELINKDAKDLVDDATRKPKKRSDPRRSFYRRLMARGWLAAMTWAVHVAIGTRPPESILDPVSRPRSALARVFGITTDPSVIRAGLDGSRIEDFGITRLLAVLNEDIGAGELYKVREDCWVLSHSDKARTLILRVLAAMWRSVNCRAVLLPGLILLHRSPDHHDSLLEIGKRHSDSPAVQQFEIPHARS